MLHLHAVDVMDTVLAGHHGAVFTHSNDEVLHALGLESLGDDLDVFKVDAVGDINGVVGQDSGLVLIGRKVGGAGEQPIGQGSGRSGVDHDNNTRVVGPLSHCLNNRHGQFKLHHDQIVVADLILQPSNVLHR